MKKTVKEAAPKKNQRTKIAAEADQAPTKTGRFQPSRTTGKLAASGPDTRKQTARGPKLAEKRQAKGAGEGLGDQAAHEPHDPADEDEDEDEEADEADDGDGTGRGGKWNKTVQPKKCAATTKGKGRSGTKAGDAVGGKTTTRKRGRDDDDDGDGKPDPPPRRGAPRKCKKVN